jgi:hypothetical protein
VSRGISAATCALADINRAKRAFSKGVLDFDNGPQDYRGCLGEYPRRRPYRPLPSTALALISTISH